MPRNTVPSMAASRSTSERIEQTLERLATDDHIWVATGSADGLPHLVPLSLAWDGTRVLVVTRSDTPTVHNVASSGRARLALDSTDDVVILDADVTVTPLSDADDGTLDSYVERTGWDPRSGTGTWSMLICTPTGIQAWNSVNETRDRTVMSDGRWRSSD